MKRTAVYPFTAIVGQEEMKLSLILNVINPALGGVLIKGEKGTAKSTAVRALAELLPPMAAVHGCRFHCDPHSSQLCDDCTAKLQAEGTLPEETINMRVVELPVSATEDRVVGTLDIEHAIKHGEKKFEPGILAQANRNILYVDEINLLDDHVVDALQRVEVIKRRLAYENDAESFIAGYKEAQEELAEKIIAAGKLLPEVTIDDKLLETVAKLSVELGVDGHRADITVIKTALTLAAFNGRKQANLDDLKEAAKLVLPHRMRRRPFEEGELDWNKVESFLAAEA